jgi:hypothetical protein
MPSTITPVALPPLNDVVEVHIDFHSETPTSVIVVVFSDGSQRRFPVPRDSTFLALAAATGTAPVRMYNVLLPLCGFVVGVIT